MLWWWWCGEGRPPWPPLGVDPFSAIVDGDCGDDGGGEVELDCLKTSGRGRRWKTECFVGVCGGVRRGATGAPVVACEEGLRGRVIGRCMFRRHGDDSTPEVRVVADAVRGGGVAVAGVVVVSGVAGGVSCS